MPNCKSFLVTDAERKNVRRRARFEQHQAASSYQAFFFLQGKSSNEIHSILKEILGEHAPTYVTVKSWLAQFKLGYFPTCVVPRPGRQKTVNNPEIIEQIQQLILEGAEFRLNQ